ncbi:2-amino-4-hydroxy-6-hydroxymethyldihydropteridine pyrophosphokinase [Candidatus Cyrtobacter comes]|uniref:2-amino-4-hydroxy-6-hydroxymethyldihydropteridine pyrophosphokinase n=1 Tax=Candidatus Cyrtobacter comes TaxID=675776 RepID=A0ABU5L788_9RICK|nr:2-amino-4-hydroxy-6-hydroxymethyldihydropteridine diphosphokinase [Candidatus Cyrtobacter comes]MDZ5761984.1 2-amino-4-hydroxy-6-hydroxymethyldihydropteridine pyrophosphokinase [Candidatus Cyrtobacter comes]
MLYLISLGSNVGDRLHNMRSAVAGVRNFSKILDISSLYESKALLPPGAPKSWNIDYLNSVLSCASDLEPHDFLSNIREIECEMGRGNERKKWSPRIIDIDILMCSNCIISDDLLQIPHPYMHERPFIIIPASEIAPNLIHPILNVTLSSLQYSIKSDNNPKIITDNCWYRL